MTKAAPAISSAMAQAPAHRPSGRSWLQSRKLLLALLAFEIALGVVSYRAITKLNPPGIPDHSHWGLADFRDAIYYPVRSFLDGGNPYDAEAFSRLYPVGNEFPMYSPLTLLVHLPFGLLPYEAAELAYYVLTILLILVIAHLTLVACDVRSTAARILGLSALVLISRPGHWNLLLGQYAVTVAVGAYVALHYARSRPWLAGLGLALATIKPTYGVPLAFLMFCRRDMGAVAVGVAVAGLGALAAAVPIVHAAGGIGPFASSLTANYAAFKGDSGVDPMTTLFRVDALPLLARVSGHNPGVAVTAALAAFVLALGGFGVWRVTRSGRASAGDISVALICLSVIICTYHQTYDLVLLVWPLTTVALARPPWASHSALRWVLLLALGLPMANYLATGTAVNFLHITGWPWLLVRSFNSVALLASFFLLSSVAMRRAD